METLPTLINDEFINQLFHHPTFRNNLQKSIHLEKFGSTQRAHFPINAVIEDLSLDIANQLASIAQIPSRIMQEQIRSLRMELQKIKEVHLSQSTKADYFGKEISEDINFEDEQLFDLPSIKRTINSLQERMKEISLNSSAFLDTSELLRESRIKEDFIQERIHSEITKFQESFVHQHDNFEGLVNKRIEMQQKTINNILETLNELHPSPKQDKSTALLASSKSATKLKTFFGFG